MRHRFVAVTVLALVLAVTASAEELQNQVGVGFNVLRTVRLSYWDYWYGSSYSASFTDLYLPIRFGQNSRVEPEIGFGLLSVSSRTEYALRLRMGVFRTTRLGDSFMSSYGIRGGFMNAEQTSLSLALCFGGDHFFSSHFSLGGEIQLEYCHNASDYHTLVTTGLVIVRWYIPVSG